MPFVAPTTSSMRAALKHVPSMPADYEPCNVSDKVLRIVQSYTEFVNQRVWKKTN